MAWLNDAHKTEMKKKVTCIPRLKKNAPKGQTGVCLRSQESEVKARSQLNLHLG